MLVIVLDPSKKMSYFCKHWPSNLVLDIEQVVQNRVSCFISPYWTHIQLILTLSFSSNSTHCKLTQLPSMCMFTRLLQLTRQPTPTSMIPTQRMMLTTVMLLSAQPMLGWTNGRPTATPLEKDRGFQNPEGTIKGYGRVGVRVWMLLPSTNPYLWWGYQGYQGYQRGMMCSRATYKHVFEASTIFVFWRFLLRKRSWDTIGTWLLWAQIYEWTLYFAGVNHSEVKACESPCNWMSWFDRHRRAGRQGTMACSSCHSEQALVSEHSLI